MANLLSSLSTLDSVAGLLGIFDWEMTNGSFTNPNKTTVAFHVITGEKMPIEQFVAGAVNTYNLLTGGSKSVLNTGLFNTNLGAQEMNEDIVRKYAINKPPLCNFDQPVDLGMGGQDIVLRCIFSGTMYMTAFTNMIQCLFNNNASGLGVLNHPLYGKIKNVLPVRCRSNYSFQSLNCVIVELTFITADITHLSAGSVTTSTLAEITKWFTGTQNAITSIGGTIAAAKGITSDTVAVL